MIQSAIEGAGFSVIREFVGFGMGDQMHQGPQIPCYGGKGTGDELLPGMILNIHVIATMGNPGIAILDDAWSVVASDRQPSVSPPYYSPRWCW